MRTLLVVLCLLVPLAAARAGGDTIKFGGEIYKRGFADLDNPVAPVVEFVRKGDTVANWGKLIGYFHFPKAGDAASTAKDLAARLTEKDHVSNPRITENPETGEVLIDFMTTEPGSGVGEFDIFKYAKAGDNQGLVAFQYAEHVKLGEMDSDAFSRHREEAVKAVAEFDMDEVNGYFWE